MTYTFSIRDRDGERKMRQSDFPIVIGNGPTADITVTALEAHQEVAYIGLDGDRPFVQPAASTLPILYNGKRLENSEWLLHGDNIQVGASKIEFRVEENLITFQVSDPDISADLTSCTGLPGGVSSVEIRPVSFRPDRRDHRLTSSTPLKWLISAGFGLILSVLCVSVWFVFTARQVVIHIDPEPDRVAIQGGMAAPKLGAYYLLRSGEYTLRAVKECFQPLEKRFAVAAEKSQKFSFSMTRLPGRLSLQAHRADQPSVKLQSAVVLIDGKEAGPAPLAELDVNPGRRSIEIRAENYQDFHTELVIEGCDMLQEFDLALVPEWSEIRIQSIPEGAAVHVDGKFAGNTPLKLDLLAGDHDLEVTADRFKPWRTRLAVAANQPRALETVYLQPADGTLTVQTNPTGANVMLGERFAGQSPMELKLSADTTHLIQISKTGYEKEDRSVKLGSEESKTITVTLTPHLGVIHFAVEPVDAEIFIDGKSMGQVPRQLRLVAVAHQLEIVKDGYETYRTRITPRPGFAQEITVALTQLSAGKKTSAAIINAKNGYALQLVRPQAFTMGSSRREQGRRSNETLRDVKLQRPFYMGVREVTNKEFRQFLAAHDSGIFEKQSLNHDELPVVQVTWEQAVLFCNWLSARESLPPAYVKKGETLVAVKPMGIGYRLPTEAEWEYCARFNNAETNLKYPWGNTFPPTPRSGNFADMSAKGLLASYLENYNDGYPVAAPPAKFNANALGLYDLGGNVAEWCHDFYSIYPYTANKVYIDPAGPEQGQHHVVRGSSWENAGISMLRLAYRGYSSSKGPDLGFRICRYLN